jgi:Tol biopolymer transport system component
MLQAMPRGCLLAIVFAAGAIALVPTADSASHASAAAPQPQIFVIGSNGAGETNLTRSASGNDSPSWSPDGTRLAFSSNRDGNWEIYTMNADGTGITRLTTNRSADDAAPAWSPDGTRIAFHSDRDGNYEIYVMNADGSGQTNLTKESGAEDATPSWAPSGAKIVFASEGDLYTMNADGTSQVRLTTGTADDFFPAWSPDGTKIALGTRVAGKAFIEVVNAADGSGRTRLTHGGSEYEPRWSKDGTKIAYSDFSTGLGHIFLMNADGSGASRVSGVAKRADYDPSWSPDGTRIAFAGYVDTIPPQLLVAGPPKQRVVKQKGVLLLVACDEPCRLRVSGVVTVAGQRRKLKLGSKTLRLDALDAKLLKLQLPGGGLRKVRAALTHQKKARTVVTIRGTDAAGNSRARTYRSALKK